MEQKQRYRKDYIDFLQDELYKKNRGLEYFQDIINAIRQELKIDPYEFAYKDKERLNSIDMGKKKYPTNNHFFEDKEPQSKKKWHPKDLISVHPKTKNQEHFFNIWNNTDKHVFVTGPAGSGKTLMSYYLGLKDVLNQKYEKMIIVRSPTPTVQVGFLQGNLDEKLDVYKNPYRDISDQMFEFKKSYDNLEECGKIKFLSSGFLRGCNFDNSIVLFEECQSSTYHEISTVLTRIGENSRLIVSGDYKQNDLAYKRFIESGFIRLEKVLSKMKCIERVQLTSEDILRSGFVKEFIEADEKTIEI